MPLFIAALWGALVSMLGTMVAQVLLSLGIAYLTFTGVDASLTWAKDVFLSGLSGAPAGVVGMAKVLKIGVCVSMLLSAVAVRLTLAGLSSGVMKKMVVK